MRLLCTSSIVVLGLLIALALAYYAIPKPNLGNSHPYSSAIFDIEGQLLKLSLAADDRYRLYTPLEQIAPNVIKATVLYEDQQFYTHNGVNFSALLRAFYATYVARKRRVGASTITMQTARLLWNIPSNTVIGKLHQIGRAIQLNRHYNKDDILQTYLNLAPYGGNIEGVGAASLIYFNKKASELTLPEALTLAVIPQNPNERNPSQTNGYSALAPAKRVLFTRWQSVYPNSELQADLVNLPLQVNSSKALPNLAPHFTAYVDNQHHEPLYRYIYSTIRTHLQTQIEDGISDYIASQKSKGIENAAAIILNYTTMEIEAMVGSADFYSADILGQVNGTIAKRSPGSALKPFVYGLAIDQGLIHPLSMLKDSPSRYAGFSPENFDKLFLGPLSATQALVKSRNLPAVELQSKLSRPNLYNLLQQAGIKDLKPEAFYGLALALGGSEITMLELAQLYAMLANEGKYQQVKYAYSSNNANNLNLNETNMSSKKHRVKQLLSAEASFMLLDMLSTNLPPNAFIPLNGAFSEHAKTPVAWKTGTSWAYRDAWAIGVSGDYVVAVWIGNFNGEGNNAFIGRTAAGPLLFKLLDILGTRNTLSHWREVHSKQPQLDLKQIDVCTLSGDLANQYCPHIQKTWFIPGVSPIKASNIFRAITINTQTGLRTCKNSKNSEYNEIKVFEFWPSDFQAIFAQAGINKAIPPPFSPECLAYQDNTLGEAPQIQSPQSELSYVINADVKNNTIIFSTISDGDVTRLYWFVDNQFVGQTQPNEVFEWQGRVGEFKVSVTDDLGRSDTKTLRVKWAPKIHASGM